MRNGREELLLVAQPIRQTILSRQANFRVKVRCNLLDLTMYILASVSLRL